MKRILCLLLAVMMLFSLSVQAFADDDVLFCRICGRQIPTDSNVCPYCGEKVIHMTDAAVSAPASDTSTVSTASEKSRSALDAKLAAGVAEARPAETTATDVKTALAQMSAPSPVTATAPTAAVPGPFNTVLGDSSSYARVRVTKSPTSESVPYGGSCMFIAHAANATSITWYIANNDASLITTAAEAPANVPGLSVSGTNTDTLYLSGIPSWMNGCQVQACFTGEGGPVYTEAARIWTYEPEPEVQYGGWSFWDWFNYIYWDDPDLPDYPWWYWYDAWTPDPGPRRDPPPRRDHDFDLDKSGGSKTSNNATVPSNS